MSINKLYLEPDGLQVGVNQLVASGGGVSVGKNLIVFGNAYVGSSNANIFASSGRVGIGTGTVTNSNILSVFGNTDLYGNIRLVSTTAGIYFADGTFQTTAASGGGTGNYSNANVASYLSGPVVVGNLTINNTTASTSTVTGALLMGGGAGIQGAVHVGGLIYGATTLNIAGTATVNALTSNGTVTGTAFIPSGATVPTNGMYLPAANTVGFATNTTNRVNINANGNVLINTATAPLGGNATVVVSGLGTNGGGIELVGGGQSGGGNISALSAGGINFGTFTGAVGSEVYAERMRIDVNGYLGIGATTVPAQLTVAGAGQLVSALLDSGVRTGTIQIHSTDISSGAGGALMFSAPSQALGGTTPQWAIKMLSTDATSRGIGDLAFSGRTSTLNNSLTEAMRITSDGLVGIATTTPGSTLDVNGVVSARTAFSTAGTARVNASVSNVYGLFGQNVTVNSANASTATSNGALIITAGGAGIAGNVNAGGSRSLFVGAVGIGTSTAAGMIAAAGVGNDAYHWGNVRIANTSTTSSGIVFSDGTVQTTAGSPALKTNSFGTAGTIQFAGAGNTFAGDTATFFYDDTNNRLGIGTGTPGQTVSAYSVEAVLFNTRPGGAARQEITVGNVTTYGAVLGYDPSIGNSIGYLRRGDSAAGTPAITWAYGTGAYRIGINGVTQPQNTMDIGGTVAIGSGFSGVAVMTNTNGLSVQGSVGIGTFTPSTSANNMTLWSATGAGIELASGGAAGGGNIQAVTGGGLKFSTFTGGVGLETYTERIVIDGGGQVGIGVLDALSAFDVNGIASFRSAVSVAGAVTVASLASNGAVSGTTGTFTSALYGGSFNSAGTATVAAVISNSTVTGTAFVPSSATVPTNGIFLPAANTVGIAAGGLEEVRVTTTGVGFGGAQQSSFNVTVNGGALGTVANSQVRMLNIFATDTNASSLEFSDVRNASGGTDWTTAGMRMQQKIDATYMGWVGFNNGNTTVINNGGISFGAGLSTLGPNGVPETMRITSTGVVGILTTAPISTLDVNGVISARTAFSTAGAATVASVTSNGTVTGTAFVPTSATIPLDGMYLPTASSLGWSVDSVAVMSLVKNGTNATANLAVTGNITATGEVTAYYSDARLKDNITLITNAMDKVSAINGVYYNPSQLAETLLHESRHTSKVGLIAQEVEAVLPHVIRSAPFDTNIDGSSRSGENYKTIQYEKVIPLLVEAIKELEARIVKLEANQQTS